jgi:dolichyl-phosphate-mannose-protein mannosyltransferase
MLRTGIAAAIIFALAHFAMLVGVTASEKVDFDEVHDVPAMATFNRLMIFQNWI